MFHFENFYRQQGKKRIAGLDEVGRGPLAGPVVASAVVLPPEKTFEGVNDSKQLTVHQRAYFFTQLIECSDIQIGIGIVSERIIDKINILEATKLAMRKAVENLSDTPDHLLIDGLLLEKVPISQTKLIKGDSRSASIAAASIIAKVVRDTLMAEYDSVLKGYNFAQHKGYGTQEHLLSLEREGVSIIHRRSFAPVYTVLHKDVH